MSFAKTAVALSFASLVAAGNGAIAANPPSYAEDITVRGSDFLWAVFAVMAATGLGVTAWGSMQPIGKRAFHWLSAAILFTASIAYFSMASNLGKTGIAVEFVRQRSDLFEGDGTPLRAVYYARYIDWTITTPLLLLDLLLATGLPLSTIFGTIFMDLLMIEVGLIGALVVSTYKWGYFTFGCVAMFYVFWVLFVSARRSAYAISDAAGKAYIRSTVVLVILWTLYPIAWGLCEGGNVITPDSEMVFYGVLDLLAKPGFIIFHLLSLRKIDYESFHLNSGHFSVGAQGYTKAPAGELAGASTIAGPSAPAKSKAANGHTLTGHQEEGATVSDTATPGMDSYGAAPVRV